MRYLTALFLAAVLATPALAQRLATPNDAGLTYGHVHLNVTDIELHKRLWVEHFGGRVVEKGRNADGEPILTAVVMENFIVALSQREPSTPSNQTVMDHFGFKVRDVSKFMEKWEAAGLPVSTQAQGFAADVFLGAEGQTNAYIDMPDGVLVELQEDQGLHVEIAGYHIHYRTEGHEDLLQWYTDVFDLEVRPRGRIATTTNVPGMNLSFGGSMTPRAATQGTAIDHIGFELDDLEAFCQRLEAMGIEFDIPYREVPAIDLKIAFFTDPSGVRIELTEGYDEY